MSQPNRPRKPTAPPTINPVPAVISAIVVVAVLVLVAVLLLNRPSPRQQATVAATEIAQTALAFAAAPQPTLESVPTLESLATPETALTAQPTVAAGANPGVNARKSYNAAPPITIDPAKNYTATITTPRGDIVVKLRPDLAPETVNNFVFLAREGFYNGLTWHRVLPGFMAQGGDPDGTGGGGPGYSIKGEFTDQVLFDRPGLLAMARTSDPDSAGSQFFITTAPADYLNNEYAIFGEVTQGQEIVNGIPLRDPDAVPPPTAPGETIEQITISES